MHRRTRRIAAVLLVAVLPLASAGVQVHQDDPDEGSSAKSASGWPDLWDLLLAGGLMVGFGAALHYVWSSYIRAVVRSDPKLQGPECPECGRITAPEDNYCGNCGRSL